MKDKRFQIEGLNPKAVYDNWVKSYDAEDLDGVMAAFDEAVIFSEPCANDQTYDDLVNWYKFDFARTGPRPHWRFAIEWMDASCDLAVVIAQWTGFTDPDTRLEAQVRGFRSIDVFRKGSDGWKIVRTFNEGDGCNPPASQARKTKKKKRK